MESAAEVAGYQANMSPIDFEVDLPRLPLSGVLPEGLEGMLVRNGPNPLYPDPAEHWFTGSGMVHRFAFANGEVSYSNRWVRTRRWFGESSAGKNLGTGFVPVEHAADAAPDGAANTNVLLHAGQLMALEEAHPPVALDPETLSTRGALDFGGRLNGAFTAHPKADPDSGELVFFSYGAPDGLSAGISVGSVDARGVVSRIERFEAPYASMIHDFMVTAHHVLVPVLPLTASMERAQAGLPPFAWEPERGAFVGVICRDDGVSSLEWWRGPTCFVYHVMNAWEDDGCIHADVMQFDAPPNFPWPDGRPIDNAGPARLCRWTFDLTNPEKVFTQQRLSDVAGEFPRIDDRYAGKPYRHGWLAGHSGEKGGTFAQIVHIDHLQSRHDIYALDAGDSTSEPVFVPRADDAPEGDGWILAVVYRGAGKRSDLLVFEALNVAAGPLATISLPHRVPNGFHGNWVAARDLARHG